MSFIEQAAEPAWKEILFRPLTYLFAFGLVGVAFAVWYLNYRTSGPDLPTPSVSYSLLPNEGKSKGLPVAIKINQLTVFMIDDPTDSPGGAARAKSVVKTLEDAIKPLKADAGGVRFAVDDQRPLILEIMQESGERKQLAEVTPEDAALAGEKDAQRLAAEWAKRLTDAVNLLVFGTAPNFSTDSDFGQALLTMYKTAMSDRGKISKRSLDDAYQKLTAGQKRALEDPPVARRASALSALSASLR